MSNVKIEEQKSIRIKLIPLAALVSSLPLRELTSCKG